MSEREDYITKFSALLQGKLICPTQSDKKTWGAIEGLTLPGLNFSHGMLAGSMPTKSGRIASDAVLDQLIAYAKTEDAAISKFLRDEKGVKDENKVSNYDRGSKVVEKLPNGEEVTHTVKQGGRYSGLLGVWNGDQFIEFNRTFDENGVYQTEEMCQQRAHEYFFGKREGESDEQLLERQRDMINTILLKQIEKEMEHMSRLGIIETLDDS